MKNGNIANKQFNNECELFFHNYEHNSFYYEKYGFGASNVLKETVNITRQTFDAWVTPNDKVNAMIELRNLFMNASVRLVFNQEHRREIGKHLSHIVNELMRIHSTTTE